jgi:hypothetical protein
MKDALFWIEWIARLERSVDAASQDATGLARGWSTQGLARLNLSGRHLSVLLTELQGLDAGAIAGLPGDQVGMRVQNIAQLLEAIVLQISRTADWTGATCVSDRTRVLTSIDGLLRDCRYQTRLLIGAKPNIQQTTYTPAAATPVLQASL